MNYFSTSELTISITPCVVSGLRDIDLFNLPFGKQFSDHMLEADYENGVWKNVVIRPYQPLSISPALSALHYGQSIFEGLKAYRSINDTISIFRIHESHRRFNRSAERMKMPSIPEALFIEGIRQLVVLDSCWVPSYPDHSLYIRPLMFATDEALGVKPSDTYKFVVILSPSGPYYNAPLKIAVEHYYVRASTGGTGYAKVAGNYGSSMLATANAKHEGYDQVLWMDAIDHRFVQEMGLMNFFFIRDRVAITPSLEEGTILGGITRDSCIILLNEMGYKVEERHLPIREILDAYRSGRPIELFGTGTAATISLIGKLRYQDTIMEFPVDRWTVAPALRKRLMDLREGKCEDKYNWLYPVQPVNVPIL